MTKGSAFDFLGLYGAILKDISVYLPDDQLEWDRDLITLTRVSSTRGQSCFTMDLPALGKLFDRGFETGRLEVSGKPLAGPKTNRSILPKLFWGLWMRVFDEDGCLKHDIDPNVIFFLRTVLYVGKNLEGECAPRYLYEATQEFFDVEATVIPPSDYWDGDSDDPCPGSLGHLRDLDGLGNGQDLFPRGNEPEALVLEYGQCFADRISTELGWFDPSELKFRHGPGAVSDLRKGKYKYYFPNWGPRLDRSFPFDLYGSTPWGLLERLQPSGLEVGSDEPASKFIAVPKTQKGPRLIASEPTCNQWIQQGIRDFLYLRLASTELGDSIDFSGQDKSRDRTLSGSIDGSISTIDLKSASDRISCGLVQRIFRRNYPLLNAMRDSRTRFMLNSIDSKNPSLVKLRKFSTMGSALTFPVQSIVFACLAVGVGRYFQPHTHWRDIARQVRVFGDDIIVPNQWESLLTRVLTRVGLKVNHLKTFSEGNFRESCGMDAWKGYDVTPPHVTMRFNEPQARTLASNVAVSNNFFLKGLWYAADWVKRTVTTDLIPVVGLESGIFGFKSYCGAPIPRVVKWSKDTHQDIALCRTVVARQKVVKQETAASLLQFFTEEPSPYVDFETGVVVAGTPVIKRAWVPVYLLG